MMQVNCLSCGHKISLDAAYDDYEGQIKCLVCDAVLEITAKNGKLVKSVNVVKAKQRRLENKD